MSKMVRVRMFLALGLIAAVLVAAVPRSVEAGGGPMVKTGYFYLGGQCTTGPGKTICTPNPDTRKHLKVVGSYFTPNGLVDLKIIEPGNGVLWDVTTRANSSGMFGYRFLGFALCIGGYRYEAVAIDLQTGRQSNFAEAFRCNGTL